MRDTVGIVDEETGRRPSNLSDMGTRAVLLAGALLLCACGGGGGETSSATLATDPTTTTTRPATTTTTDPEAAIRAEVEEAYYAQWDAFVEIFADPDPSNPLIDQHFTGEQREQLLTSIGSFATKGHALRRPADPALFLPNIEDIRSGDDTATVSGCVVDGLVVVEEATGAVVNDAVATIDLRVEFERIDGAWKVSRTERLGRHEGVAPCGD